MKKQIFSKETRKKLRRDSSYLRMYDIWKKYNVKSDRIDYGERLYSNVKIIVTLPTVIYKRELHPT